MKLNKKLLLIDLLTLCGTLIMYVICAVTNNIFGIYNLAINITLCFLAVAMSVCSILFSYYKKSNKNEVSFINFIVPVIFFIIAFLIYFLPAFGFVGNKGINNSICFLMTFTLGVRYLLVLSQLIKLRSINIAVKTPKNSINGSKDIYNNIHYFFKYFAVFLFVVAVLVAIINCFFLFMDLSNVFNAFSDLDPKFEVLGQKIN